MEEKFQPITKKFDVLYYKNPHGRGKEFSHKYVEIWETTQYFCPNCGNRTTWHEISTPCYSLQEGGEQYICIKCNYTFQLGNIKEGKNEQDNQRLLQLYERPQARKGSEHIGRRKSMKRMFLALMLVLAMASPAFAIWDVNDYSNTGPNSGLQNTGTINGGVKDSFNTTNNMVDNSIKNTATGGQGGEGGKGGTAIIEKGAIENRNTNMNVNTNSNKIDNTNVNVGINKSVNVNENKQGQQQGQIQGQSQDQGQGQGQEQMNNWTQTYIAERELPGAIPVIPNPIPLIQGGKVGDITAQIVRFAIAARPYKGEAVVKVLKVVKGSIFDRVRLEDIEIDLLNAYRALTTNGTDGKKIRYLVQYKDSAMGAGIGGGGAGSISGLNGGSAAYGGTGSLAVLPGYTRSTADPAYLIKFYLVD
jgi:predicted RNA-binding Zn-ribbon protein involved in translation (DUF1610 family)